MDICIHYKMITTIILVTICPHKNYYNVIGQFLMVYSISPMTYYITRGFYLLFPSLHIFHSPPSFMVITYLFSVTIESIFILTCLFCFLAYTYKIMCICLSLTDLFHIAWYPLHIPMLSKMARFHFCGWVILCCLSVLRLICCIDICVVL